MNDFALIVELCPRLRRHLEDHARAGQTVRYRDLAHEAEVPGPHTIHKTTEALEAIARADHAADRPMLAALAVGRGNDGLPGPGFFQLLRELGRYDGPDSGEPARIAHAREVNAVVAAYQDG
ncbi:hypothetical protein CKO21_07790 [Rhodovibrio salinarum]|uniref:Uncharacterized protein n=2 Tax=Rhodovibrio salinarum TaxID=1087 RepID=A0A934QHJ7_9PROT|nr:hypothetical protein [Rhodovibrio salinarum]